jgi:hypothetical protein
MKEIGKPKQQKPRTRQDPEKDKRETSRRFEKSHRRALKDNTEQKNSHQEGEEDPNRITAQTKKLATSGTGATRHESHQKQETK